MAGTDAVKSPTFVVFDSHIECSPGWLEPLLARIQEDRRHIVMPKIDGIDADTFEYAAGFGIDVLGFVWTLSSTGADVQGRVDPNSILPIPSPVMAGGLFAMDRLFFEELGKYDSEMRGWGGEEIELSFKGWMCGGSLEVIPCSHVAHIFRSKGFWEGASYTVGAQDPARNRLRTAKIWMDEYAEITQMLVDPENKIELGDTSEMERLRDRLECKSFAWFLQNVYPELYVPSADHVVQQGSLRSRFKNLCVDTMHKHASGSTIGVFWCHYGVVQLVYLSPDNKFRFPGASFLCADRGNDDQLYLYTCQESSRQLMYPDDTTGLIHSEANFTSTSDRCMTVTEAHLIAWLPCDPAQLPQQWDWKESEAKLALK